MLRSRVHPHEVRGAELGPLGNRNAEWRRPVVGSGTLRGVVFFVYFDSTTHERAHSVPDTVELLKHSADSDVRAKGRQSRECGECRVR
jgi:hypothetical protein